MEYILELMDDDMAMESKPMSFDEAKRAYAALGGTKVTDLFGSEGMSWNGGTIIPGISVYMHPVN